MDDNVIHTCLHVFKKITKLEVVLLKNNKIKNIILQY